MSWVVIQSNRWLKEKEPFDLLRSYIYIQAQGQKNRGHFETDVLFLASQWTVTEQKVVKYLNELQEEDMITFEKQDRYVIIDVVNFEEYPVPSHQKPMARRKKTFLRSITGKTPISNFDRDQNMAVWTWRMITRLVGESNLTLNSASLEDWADDIRKIIDLDGRTKEDYRDIVIWALSDEFWATVIRSPSGIRKGFDKMLDKKNRVFVPEEKKETAPKGVWQNQ